MTSFLCLETYAIACSKDIVTEIMPTPPKKSTKKSKNIFDVVLWPQMFLLTVLGMGENNFESRPIRYAYTIYFVSVSALCFGTAYYTYFNTILNTFRFSNLSNIIDEYAWWSAEIVWLYCLCVIFFFLLWTKKVKKFRSIFRLLDQDRFEFLRDLDEEAWSYVRARTRRLVVKSYSVLFIFSTAAVIWPVLLFATNGFNRKIIIYALSGVPCLIINICLSLSFSVYLCTAELWKTFNFLLKRENEESDFEIIVEKYSDRYDAMTDLTNLIAHTFRYYSTIHVCAFFSFINQLYQILYDATMAVEFKIYYWIDIGIQLTPLFAAATVYIESSKTVRSLHNVYSRFRKFRVDGMSFSSQPSPAYAYFYQRVSDENACVSLDIAGLISITKTSVAAFLFATVNWCAIIVQFRQGAGSIGFGSMQIANFTNGTG